MSDSLGSVELGRARPIVFDRVAPSQEVTATARVLAQFCLGAMVVLGGYLLFQLQPIVGKQLLPWFGGGVAVWSACQLFFQVTLLAGYLYAFLLSRYCSLLTQIGVHASLLVVAFACFPTTLLVEGADVAGEPVGAILWILLATVGVKFLALAGTSPLVQVWYASIRPTGIPTRFFALSNAASLGALLSYPFVLEPTLTNTTQLSLWNAGYLAYVGVAVLAALAMYLQAKNAVSVVPRNESVRKVVCRSRYAEWIGLSAIGSVAMLAVTNHICSEMSITPVLWVIPLALYLVSFVIAFEWERRYRPRLIAVCTVAAIAATGLQWCSLVTDTDFPWIGYVEDTALGELLFDYKAQIGVFMLWMFLLCWLAHGELVRIKPRKEKLPVFYLCVAFGGALGGGFINYVCPLLFSTYHELKLIAVVGVMLATMVLLRLPEGGLPRKDRVIGVIPRLLFWRVQAGTVLVVAMLAIYGANWSLETEGSVYSSRNFYGVLRMELVTDEEGVRSGAALYHGETLHGFQYFGEWSNKPTTYYCRRSGVGLLMRSLNREGGRNIGVVGLGVGTLAAYGKPGDRFTFYEIDEKVRRIANEQFTFLRDTKADTEIVMGDARVSLDREIPRGYDVLVLDAFSGDGVPTHLLTREAFEIYGKHLAQDGVLAVHVSNRYLNLFPVVRASAERYGYTMAYVEDTEDWRIGDASSDWLILGRGDTLAERAPRVLRRAQDSILLRLPAVEWTDEFANLLSVMR